MAIKFTNNATSSLASAINNTDTSLTVAPNNGSLFPSLGSSDYFYCTLTNSANVVEIVLVTARSGDVFTIARGKDNTTASSWNYGDKVELRLVAASLQNLSGGATGGGFDTVFYENSLIVTSSYTLSANKNAHSVGPISISNGASVTIPSGQRWIIF